MFASCALTWQGFDMMNSIVIAAVAKSDFFMTDKFCP
jgi:hypothetical protein